MTIKNQIIQEFLNGEKTGFNCYQTDHVELSNLYDIYKEHKKAGRSLRNILLWEKAISEKDYNDSKIDVVNADRIITVYDMESKTEKKFRVAFKYVVYNFFEKMVNQIKDEMKNKQNKQLTQLAKVEAV